MVRWWWSGVCVLALWACDDGGEGGAPAGDAAVADGALAAPDRGGPDAATPRDAGPDAAAPADAGPDAASPADAAPIDADIDAGPDAAPPAADAGGPVDAEVRPPDAGPCPPAGPYGTTVGEVAPDLELPDCEGTPHRLHATCGEPLWIFEFAGWCPPCRQFAAGLEARAQAALASGVQVWMIVSANDDFGRPDAAVCRRYREQYGLTFPVLYDAQGQFQQRLRTAQNAVNVVIDAEGVITFHRQFASDADVAAAVQGVQP